MSASSSIQAAVMDLLGQPGALRVPVPIVQQRPKDLTTEILNAAALGDGLCLYVYPVLPGKVQEDTPFVFVDEGDLRVRILERPALTEKLGVNAYQIADDVANFLHWQPKVAGTALGGLVVHPLQLQRYQAVNDAETRMVDVSFNATYQISHKVAPEVDFEGTFESAAEGLQAICEAQIRSQVASSVPVLRQRDHDLSFDIEAAGHPVKIEILPPMPMKALEGVPFVFFSDYQVRVRVTEIPQLNSGPDVYDLTEAVMAALQWHIFDNFLAHPMQLAQRPIEMRDNLDRREIEITFNAVLGFEPES